jgi:hypothetical protein
MWMNLQFDIASFVEKCFDKVTLKTIDSIEIGGACLIRRVLTTKHQVPDSFPYVIERDYGEELALEFEQYVASNDHQSIENLDKNLNFTVGVDHMNQVVSFERIIYFGYIQEVKKDPSLLQQEENNRKKTGQHHAVAFGSRVKDASRLPGVAGAKGLESHSPTRGRDGAEGRGSSALGGGPTTELQSELASEGFTPYKDNFGHVQDTIRRLQQKYTPAKIVHEGRQEALQMEASEKRVASIQSLKSLPMRDLPQVHALYDGGIQSHPTLPRGEASSTQNREDDEVKLSLLDKINRRRIGKAPHDNANLVGPITPTKLKALNSVAVNKNAAGSKV